MIAETPLRDAPTVSARIASRRNDAERAGAPRIAVSADPGGAERECSCGNPKIVFVKGKAEALLSEFDFCVMARRIKPLIALCREERPRPDQFEKRSGVRTGTRPAAIAASSSPTSEAVG